jgi:CheY-like chemotaxis protein
MSDENGIGEVFLAEDERTMREMLRVPLENAGYHVFEAANGRTALQTLRRSPCRMVVVLDADLSGASSQSILASAMTDAGVGCHAFVYLTSTRPEQETAEMRGLLAQLRVPVLRTPFTIEMLIEAVGQAANRPLSSTLAGGTDRES